MPSVLRPWLTPVVVCALALCLGGAARAAEEPGEGPGGKGEQEKVYTLLRDLINEGADLYNGGDYAGCYYLWEGALKALRPSFEHHGEWQKTVDGALAEARTNPVMWQRAWALRRGMDKIRDDIHPPKKTEPAATAEGTGARPPGTTETPGTRSPGTTDKPAPKADTLWERLGGVKGVTKVVDDFTAVAATDPKVDFSRGGKYKLTDDDVAKFKQDLVGWISSKTGGPLPYKGKGMKVAHEGMHITDAQFNALAADLKAVLEKDGVKGADLDAVMGAAAATRKDIVEEKPEEEPKPEKPKKPDDKKPVEDKGDKKPDDKKPVGDKEDKKLDDPDSGLGRTSGTKKPVKPEDKKEDK
jgi:hemoglobin